MVCACAAHATKKSTAFEYTNCVCRRRIGRRCAGSAADDDEAAGIEEEDADDEDEEESSPPMSTYHPLRAR